MLAFTSVSCYPIIKILSRRWWDRKILNSLPPVVVPNLHLHMDLFPLKKYLKWRWTASPHKDKKYTSKWVGEAETLLSPKTPCGRTHKREGSHQAEGHIRHPNLWSASERWAPKISGLENQQGFCLSDPKWNRKQIFLLKYLYEVLLNPRPSLKKKAQQFKKYHGHTSPRMKEIHFSNLKASARGAGDSWNCPPPKIFHSPPTLLRQMGQLRCSTLPPPCYEKLGQVTVALSCCLAEARVCGWLQHFPTPWLGKRAQAVMHSPIPSLKPGCVHRQGTLTLYSWSPWVHAVKIFSHCLSEAVSMPHLLHSPAA